MNRLRYTGSLTDPLSALVSVTRVLISIYVQGKAIVKTENNDRKRTGSGATT
jgi:hypothetical protein